MKILAVSDVVVDRLYTADVAERFKGIDLILGCGDLPYEYLEFLVTAMNLPLLYVPGNHDPAYDEKKTQAHAMGCCNLDLRVERLKGLTIAGIGGSIRYHPRKPNQYSQWEMHFRINHLILPLLWQRLRHQRNLDILIAHSPPKGIHDDDDQAHIGFGAFRRFIRVFKPRYFLHGHTMYYKSNLVPPVTRWQSTEIINVYPYRIIEF